MDLGDVRMIERREHFGFALEACQAIRVAGHRGRQCFDRDLAFQVRVGRTVDLAHSAFAKERGHFVGAETRAGSQRQAVGL